MKTAIYAAIAGFCFALTACGGGGGSNSPTTDSSELPQMTMTVAMPAPTEPPTIPPADPPPLNCGVNEIADGQTCVCIDGYQQNAAGMCEMLPLPACTDFRERNADGECTYNTAEYRNGGWRYFPVMDVLYAYEQGYHGQGVTVVNGEAVSRTHDDLRENVLTMDIGLNCSNFDFFEHQYAAENEEFFRRYKCDRFAENAIGGLISVFGLTPEEAEETESFHGTATGALIVGARNGNSMQGVAPRSKLIPIPGADGFRNIDDTSDLRYVIDNEIPIVNYSIFLTVGFATLTAHYGLFADTDTVLVWSSGNNGSPWKLSSRTQTTVPHYVPELEDNWLIVARALLPRLNSHIPTLISSLTVASIQCGEAMMWCITAPGWGRTADGATTDNYRLFSGTSASAPHVSGALAVLKSAAPELPMTMIRQILLTTALDLGEAGVDPEWGWGLVNISAGIVSIEALETADGQSLRDLRRGLPPELSHLRGRLDGVEVALKITDDSYWNLPLSSVIPENAEVSGGAFISADSVMAAEYAAGDSFRFWGGADWTENKSRFIAANGGAFGAAAATDKTGFMRWTTADYSGVSGFGEFVYTDINANYGGDSLIAKVDGAFGEEWTAGMQMRDLWRHGDKFRFAIRQAERIGGGEMVLHYPVAEGDSHKAFIGESPQTIRTETARIPLKEKRTLIYGVGYSQKNDGGEWSAAAEWNSQTNAAAFYAELQIAF